MTKLPIFLIAIIVGLLIAIVSMTINNGINEYNKGQELQAELVRLRFYKDLFDNGEVTLVYNGCEEMRKQLGLDKEVK